MFYEIVCFLICICLASAKRLSKFAQEREKQSKAGDKEESSSDPALPSRNIIIGDIFERIECDSPTKNVIENVPFNEPSGFPKAKRIDQKVIFSAVKHFLIEFQNMLNIQG